MDKRKPTLEQRIHLGRRAERTGKAYKAELWQDYDLAEKACNQSELWRRYRKIRPASDDPVLT